MELEVPLISFSSIGPTEKTGRSYHCTNAESRKQCVDLESIRAEKRRVELETDGEVRGTWKELGLERADALSWTILEFALGGSTQSSASTEAGGLLSLFLNPGIPSPFP